LNVSYSIDGFGLFFSSGNVAVGTLTAFGVKKIMSDNELHQYVNGQLITLNPDEVAEYAAAEEERAAESDARLYADVRRKRDSILRDSDVALLRAFESGASISSLGTYRQSLRGVPAQPGFPHSVTWPILLPIN
jgi:hypothetical protein